MMLQVRQLSLVITHPYLHICRHIILTLHLYCKMFLCFISSFFFVNKDIFMQIPNNGVWPYKASYLLLGDHVCEKSDRLSMTIYADELQLECHNRIFNHSVVVQSNLFKCCMTPYLRYNCRRYRWVGRNLNCSTQNTISYGTSKYLILIHTVQLKPMIKAHPQEEWL